MSVWALGLAAIAVLAVAWVWRSQRAARARRLLHEIADVLQVLDSEPIGRPAAAPRATLATRLLLGFSMSRRLEAFSREARQGDAERAMEQGAALLRELRDIATRRSHRFVTRA